MRPALRGSREGRLLSWLWLGFTLVYAGTLLHRSVAGHPVSAVQTVASVAAILAVWMWLRAPSRRRNLHLVVTLLILTASNLLLIFDALRRGQPFPLIRAGATLLVTLVIRHVMMEIHAANTHSPADSKEHTP